MDRRLATIFVADAVGFSSRMEADEENTHAALKKDREIIDRQISAADGRIFGSAGDSVIAEFVSPVAAVRCALAIQEKLRARDSNDPMEFRIGLHVGDVMVEEDNLMGDGVNIAARLEQLSPPGGIAMSQRMTELIEGNIEEQFAFVGQYKLKNISRQIGVWVWPESSSRTIRVKRRVTPFTAMVCSAILLLVGVVATLYWSTTTSETTSDLQRVAVMAFVDESPAKERGYLSNSISEGIIDELSKFSEFQTISRNSSFAFRGKDPSIDEVREALNVDFILDGSQQKIGEDLIVNVRLVNTRTSENVWSERYNGNVSKLFEFQGDIIRKVASSIGRVVAHYVPPVGTRSTVTAQHFHAQGLRLMHQIGVDNQQKIEELFRAAIEIDPKAFHGYIGMGFHLRNSSKRTRDPAEREELLNQSEAMANKALEISPNNYLVHYLLGHLESDRGNLERAIARYGKAKDLNPSFSNVYAGGAAAKLYVGDVAGALKDVKYAMKIDPLHPEWFNWQLSWILWAASECDQAIVAIQKITKMPVPALPTLAAAQACAGKDDDAHATIQSYLAKGGKSTISSEQKKYEGRWVAPGGLTRWLQDLRAAGMPE